MFFKSLQKSHAGKISPNGFILPFSILMILGVTAISVGTIYNHRMGRSSAQNYRHKIETFNAADGLMTLLSQEMINGNGPLYTDSTRVGKIKGDQWTGIGGKDMLAFRTYIMSKLPDKEITSPYLGSNLSENDYGVRWHGWIIPPYSGSYKFYVRSDTSSAFFLSKDETSTKLSGTPICKSDSAITSWTTNSGAVSAPILLQSGKRYYFEYYFKKGSGFKPAQIGWDGPEGFAERPITGQYLSDRGSDPAWAGKITVGGTPVNYQVLTAGINRYQISTEGFATKAGDVSDTAYKAPLNQLLAFDTKGIAFSPTLDFHAIFYDFLSDGSNQEFNNGTTIWYVAGDTVTPNMVEKKLTNFITKDADFFPGRTKIPKPSKNLAFTYLNCGMDQWFIDWYPGNFFRWNYPVWSGACKQDSTPGIDTWMRNNKYRDSLTFNLDPTLGPGTYTFSRRGNSLCNDPLAYAQGSKGSSADVPKRGKWRNLYQRRDRPSW